MKKLIFAFVIAISGMFVACNNHSAETTEDSISGVTDSTVVADSCVCDSIVCDTTCNQ